MQTARTSYVRICLTGRSTSGSSPDGPRGAQGQARCSRSRKRDETAKVREAPHPRLAVVRACPVVDPFAGSGAVTVDVLVTCPPCRTSTLSCARDGLRLLLSCPVRFFAEEPDLPESVIKYPRARSLERGWDGTHDCVFRLKRGLRCVRVVCGNRESEH